MTNNTKSKSSTEKTAMPKAISTKHQQVIDLLTRDNGATLEEMSSLGNWLPHSTRAFMSVLKKKGFAINSEKVGDVRRYRIVATGTA
ncbi:DUF3489 domain-containing protein [Sphingorhabdus sp.]|uniref:DUF3489 domain-containing protein n=1 Tax=Sphingorhabdus sp. TaxID=1902408 RepID=UPI0035B3C7E5